MNEFMKLPQQIVDQLLDEDLFVLTGGQTVAPATNNGSGKCSGTNNSTGSCGGTNNRSGDCQGTNNRDGICG